MPGSGPNGAYDIGLYAADELAIFRSFGMLYGAIQTGNYTSTEDDLNTIVPFQTGASTLVGTLLAAATAAEGAVQVFEKVDTGKGQVLVVDDTGAYMGHLTYPGDRIYCTPNESGTGWHIVFNRFRRWPPVSGNIYRPMREVSTAHIASGSPAQDVLFVHAFEFDEPRYIDALVVNIGATSAAGLRFKTGIWAFDPTSPGNPTGALLLSAGAEVGGAGTLTRQGYPSVLDTPQFVQRGYVGTKWNATPAVANLVTGINSIQPMGSADGRQALGNFGDDIRKGWTLADAYANAMTTLGTMVISTTTATVPIVGLRAG